MIAEMVLLQKLFDTEQRDWGSGREICVFVLFMKNFYLIDSQHFHSNNRWHTKYFSSVINCLKLVYECMYIVSWVVEPYVGYNRMPPYTWTKYKYTLKTVDSWTLKVYLYHHPKIHSLHVLRYRCTDIVQDTFCV